MALGEAMKRAIQDELDSIFYHFNKNCDYSPIYANEAEGQVVASLRADDGMCVKVTDAVSAINGYNAENIACKSQIERVAPDSQYRQDHPEAVDILLLFSNYEDDPAILLSALKSVSKILKDLPPSPPEWN